MRKNRPVIPLIHNRKKVNALIPMPYYAQVSGSCLSAVATMLTKALVPDKELEIYHFLTKLGRRRDDYGVNADSNKFKQDLPKIMEQLTGAKALIQSATDEDSLTNCLIPLLDQGIPVAIVWYEHVVLVIGYRWQKPLTGGLTKLELLFHDSKGNYNQSPNSDEGAMYTWRSWEWFKARTWFLDRYLHLLWLDKSPHPHRPLQTMGVPTAHFATWDRPSIMVASRNWVKFIISGCQTVRLVWLPDDSNGTGYGWMNFAKDKPEALADSISLEASSLDLYLPIWNADLNNPANVNLVGSIEQVGKSPELYTWNDVISLPIASAPYDYPKKIDLQGVRQPGRQKYCLRVALQKNGAHIDGFKVEFYLDHPQIVSLSQVKGAAGTEITISGRCFGDRKDTPLRKGEVLFSGEAGKVITWSDTEIKVKVPKKAVSGKVEVKITGQSPTGKQWELMSNPVPFEVEESGLWKMLKDCKVLEAYIGCLASYKIIAPGKGEVMESGGIAPDRTKKPNGNMVFIPSIFLPGSGPQLQWQEHRFSFEFCESTRVEAVGKEYIRWTAFGEVDTSGETLNFIEVKAEFHTAMHAGTVYGFKLKNIPLVRKSFQPYPLFSFELTGPKLSSHVSDIFGKYRKFKISEPRKLEEEKEFSSIQWNAATYRPYLQVLFFCAYDKRRIEFITKVKPPNQ